MTRRRYVWLLIAMAGPVLARCSSGEEDSEAPADAGFDQPHLCDAILIPDVQVELLDAVTCAPVEKAKLVVSNADTSASIFSWGVGMYAIGVTEEGCYVITASAPGYLERELPDILVDRFDDGSGCMYGANNQVTMLLTPVDPAPDASAPMSCADKVAEQC